MGSADDGGCARPPTAAGSRPAARPGQPHDRACRGPAAWGDVANRRGTFPGGGTRAKTYGKSPYKSLRTLHRTPTTMPARKMQKTARNEQAERRANTGEPQEPTGWDAPLPKPKVVREARFEFRSTNEQKAIIERAAMLRGMTAADYVRSTVLDRAREDVQRIPVTTLSERDWDRFVDLVTNPPPPNERLLRAAGQYRTIIEHSEGLDDPE